MTLQASVYRHLFFILLIILVFYVVFPLIGAFSVRHRWRKFRTRLLSSSLMPSLGYSVVHGPGSEGVYRVFGTIQALEGDTVIWLSDGNISVSAELKNVPIYILPAVTRGVNSFSTGIYPEKSPKRTYWSRLFSLPEGTRVFISGKLSMVDNVMRFEDTPEVPLTVVIYDCDEREFYSQAILTGRQRNEYWNPITPGSLTIGSFSLFIYFYMLISVPYMQPAAIIALTVSLFPVIPFLPPGIVFYYLYRFFWKKARILRAERDLLRLPVNFFPEIQERTGGMSVLLPGGAEYFCTLCDSIEEAEEILPEGSVRTSSLPTPLFGSEKFYVFRNSEGDGGDPMAESLIVPGNPEKMAVESSRKAAVFEIYSGFFFGMDLVVNSILFLLAITVVIR